MKKLVKKYQICMFYVMHSNCWFYYRKYLSGWHQVNMSGLLLLYYNLKRK